MDDA
jgi:hypothetical protein